MNFVSLSREYLADSFTLVDNIFINEYMPYAPEEAVRVYIYGLYLSHKGVNTINTMSAFAEAINLTHDQLESAFKYWEDKNLVEFKSKSPLEIKYLPLKQSLKPPKKFKAEKFSDFNRQLQDLFPERMITPNEYSEYYYLIDSTKMTPEAMLMIVKYCIDYKGNNIKYPYILTVARNWANEGILSVDAVETRLRDIEADSEDMGDLFRALSKKGTPTITDMQEYIKWTKSWGFSKESILFAASTFKRGGSIAKLDKLLDEYFRMDIFDLKDMQEYIKMRDKLFEVAIAVNKALGIYYESLDNVIETYISPWMSKGYDQDTLIKVADYCFKCSIRKLEGMNDVINKFYKMGLIDEISIDHYLNNLLKNDERIKILLEKADVRKNITASDRNYYRTWTEDWGFNDDLIMYAAELSAGRARAFTYTNKVLSNWKRDGVTTLEQAEKRKSPVPTDTPKQDYIQRTYTQDELNALFDDIDDMEV